MTTIKACVVGLVALCAASSTQAQSIPRTTELNDRLVPNIPITTPVDAREIVLLAMPALGRTGIEISPGVIVDRIIRPRCIFIANQNEGSGSVRQTADIGQVQMYCP